jgi:hypothetical protein
MTGTINVMDVASLQVTGERSASVLARLVTDTRFDQLPEPVVAATRQLTLDEIVVAAAAWETPMGDPWSSEFSYGDEQAIAAAMIA